MYSWLEEAEAQERAIPPTAGHTLNQLSVALQCPVEYVEARAVKNGIFRHNHQVSAVAFAMYPSSRGVGDAMVSARVQGMLALGANSSKIYDYLLAHDPNHLSSVSSVDDDDATTRAIAAFAALDTENASSVAETNAGESGVISLASVHTRRVYSRFSELLMVDRTHKTNRYNYQLLTFMTKNEFGEGAVVQHSLLEAIAHFKRCHHTRIHLLRVIVVDKDLNEIRALESNFPDIRVLICHFHLIKYLKE
ncbi:LOW QUALITY PROTEIN: hypothetical protein PHMEG_00025388 [Phytophthora megakarya]|uniref:ZSWIM1/3 RNaseH-like domain-containing protein n=1 Tax=Phytophthora megakarya TaxID=4795 RepID=A0A225VEP6_9STRA|nr:LOW QUALITY PROTEIN: hypothetical protein PHMEG_00025388 [Phytophthora megakarya]